MVNFIMSILLGLIPEVLYLTLFLIYCKNLKTKRIKLFILLAIGYILLIMICRFQFIFYIAYIVYTYLILKILYRNHISDLFVVSLGLSYMTIIAFVNYLLLGSNYILYYFIARLTLYLPLLLLSYKLNNYYLKYLSMWNRKEGAKIKSITLRNASLVLLNIMIIVLNVCVIWCTLYTA